MKTCSMCGETKDFSCFYKGKVLKSGEQRYHPYCIPCCATKSKMYRDFKPEIRQQIWIYEEGRPTEYPWLVITDQTTISNRMARHSYHSKVGPPEELLDYMVISDRPLGMPVF